MNIQEVVLQKGLWVVYTKTNERGRVKCWNSEYVFVVYRCDNHWEEFNNYTGVATKREDLEVIDANERL